MKTAVLVTGVAGSGKTTACGAMQSLGRVSYDIESIDGLYELIEISSGKVIPGNRDSIREGLDWNCNKRKLKELLRSQTAEIAYYFGGMANTEEIWDEFNLVIILIVGDATTLQRLSTRSLGEFGNTNGDRDWVLSWKHDIEKSWISRGGISVSAEDSPEKVAKLVLEASSNR